MPIGLIMPRLSDSMRRGTIVKWNVVEGQEVVPGDIIADVETEKATMNLETLDGGTVAVLIVAEGQSVPVGTLIAVLASPGEDLGQLKATLSSP